MVSLVCMIGGMGETLIDLLGRSLIPAGLLFTILGVDFMCTALLTRLVWRELKVFRATSSRAI